MSDRILFCKNMIIFVFKITNFLLLFSLLLLLTLPVLVVTENREVAIAQTQTREEQEA